MNPSLSSGLLTAAALIAASLTSSEVARSQTAAPVEPPVRRALPALEPFVRRENAPPQNTPAQAD